jgi:hypothetical protein
MKEHSRQEITKKRLKGAVFCYGIQYPDVHKYAKKGRLLIASLLSFEVRDWRMCRWGQRVTAARLDCFDRR